MTIAIALLPFPVFSSSPDQPEGWGAVMHADRVSISYDGTKLTEYVFQDDQILRPYFTNLRTLNGVQVTRHHPPRPGVDATDHDTMHPGLWLAFGDINGEDFWRNKARMKHIRFLEEPVIEGERMHFATETGLISENGKTIGRLTSRFDLDAQPDRGAWQLTWDAELSPVDEALVFGDQEEMGFGTRVATEITEKNGGVITNSEGLRSADKTWGQPAGWCDYSGKIDGVRVGIRLTADPGNFRGCWWHNRDYGLMVANPFGRDAMKQGAKSSVLVPVGDGLRLRFSALVYSLGAGGGG
jgi:hypothetical protein